MLNKGRLIACVLSISIIQEFSDRYAFACIYALFDFFYILLDNAAKQVCDEGSNKPPSNKNEFPLINSTEYQVQVSYRCH